jgi:S-(hydroxymethyl)mycothiol dehydrogenase
VCHTDLHYREGGINDDFPFLLGHEAAGIVEAVGEGVTEVAPGDFVILNWRAVCGSAVPAARASRGTASPPTTPRQKMTLTDGTELSPALGIGAFIEKTLVAAGQCTKVDRGGPGSRPARLRRHGGLRRRRQHRRVGRGDSSPSSAAAASARRHRRGQGRRGDDDHRRRRRRPKARGAKRFGATHTVNSRERPTRSRRSRRSPVGTAPTWSSTPSAAPRPTEQAFYARDLAGTLVLVGVPTPDMQVTLPLIEIFGRGGSLKSSGTATACPRATSPCSSSSTAGPLRP